MFRSVGHKIAALFEDKRGNVLIVAGLGSMLLAGGAGLSIDVAQWYLWKRELQMAVDAGALSGTYSLSQDKAYTTNARTAVQQNIKTATQLGTATVVLTSWGTYTDNAVQVTAQAKRKLSFTSIFTSAVPTFTASATAAIIDSGGEYCMLAKHKTASAAVNIGGNALVKLGCGIASNSNDDQAIKIYGSAQVEATSLIAMGNISTSAGTLLGSPEIQPNSVEQVDPYEGLAAPTNATSRSYDKNNYELYAGTYTGGLNIKGDHHFNPGVYVLDGGALSLNSNNSLIGTDVLFVLKNGATIDINGGSTISVSAPNIATATAWGLNSKFGGVLFFQDTATSPSIGSSCKINGNSTLYLSGTIYLPNCNVKMNGNTSPSTTCLFLIGETIDISGNAIIPNTCPANTTGVTTKIKAVRLVT